MPDDEWLTRFHEGDPATIGECYRDHFDAIYRTVGWILTGADRENVVHELFERILSSGRLRRGFTGGHLRAWLCTVARNQAIAYARRSGREYPLPPEDVMAMADRETDDDAEYLVLVDKLANALPPNLRGVFEVRFVQRMSQREAAKRLGIARSTLIYREYMVRSRLKKLLLGR